MHTYFTLLALLLGLSSSLFANPNLLVVKSRIGENESILTYKYNHSMKTIFRPDLFQILGRPADEFVLISHVLLNGSKKIFDVNYISEKNGFRSLPLINKNATKHIIVAGDSNVYGIGVDDKDVATTAIEHKCPDCRSYNRGIAGGGPNHFLALSLKENIYSEVKEASGAMVYLLQSFLVERMVNSFRYYQWDNGLSPCFNEKLEHAGNFKKCAPIKIIFFKLLSFINPSVKWFPNFPKISEADVEFSLKIILKIKEDYLNKFPNGNFYLIPLYSKDPFFQRDLVGPMLRELKIKSIEPNMNLYRKEFQIPGDGHYNKLGHQALADLILKSI